MTSRIFSIAGLCLLSLMVHASNFIDRVTKMTNSEISRLPVEKEEAPVLHTVQKQMNVQQQGEWTLIGTTHTSNSTYDLNYFKLLQVNNSTHRYASVIEVSVQADANYFNQQATYQIRVDKFEHTPDRFDGMEIRCMSGNPRAATFYVYNNALWLRSNYKWGWIYYRTVADFTNNSPLNTAPFGVTTTPPASYVASTDAHGIKCDFDTNSFFYLPISGITGDMVFYGSEPTISMHTSGTSSNGVIRGNNNTAILGWWGTTGAEDIALGTQDGSGTRTITLAAGGQPRLKILANGNVGIGTTNPGNDYKLAVEGTIGAKKVKVTQAGWADFVFQPGYKLPTLQEVEQFISANRHLPDIPSAAEIEKEGQELGEMNRKLLQKIEELTLYLIDQQKEIGKLKASNQALNEKLQDLLERSTLGH